MCFVDKVSGHRKEPGGGVVVECRKAGEDLTFEKELEVAELLETITQPNIVEEGKENDLHHIRR